MITPEQKAILLLIEKELIENDGLRFTQVLFVLGINKFENETEPDKEKHLFRDNYNDTDLALLNRIKNRKKIEPEVKNKDDFNYNSQIILNRIKTPDGTILTSYYQHDYVCHKDKNGFTYCVDGGQAHLSRTAPLDYEELSINDTAPFKVIRQSLYRGSKDKNGEYIWTLLCDMDDEWLKNVIIYNKGKGLDKGYTSKFYKKEVAYRKRNHITIKLNESNKKN